VQHEEPTDALIAEKDNEHALQHPTCVWNVINAHPDVCDPINRIRSRLSKLDQHSLECIADSPVATPDGEPPIQAFNVANRIMVGNLVVAYGDLHYYYKHGSDCEAFTFEITTIEMIHRPDELPLPIIDSSCSGASTSSAPKRRGSPSNAVSPKKNRSAPTVNLTPLLLLYVGRFIALQFV